MVRTIGLLLLLLLKFLGWALLLLLLLLVAAVFFVLFVPVRYDVRVQNERCTELGQNNPVAKLQLQLKVNWLLHLLHVTVSYGPKGMQNKICVAGIDIPKMLAQLAKRKEAKQKRREEKKRRTEKVQSAEAGSEADAKEQGQPFEKESASDVEEQMQVSKGSCEADIGAGEQSGENRSEAAGKVQEPHRKKGTSKPGSQKHRERIKKKNRKKAKAARPQKESGSSKTGIITKIRTQLSRLHKEFTDEVNRHAVSRLWKELLKLLRSYKPRKLKADLTFSLANPALTGEAVGVISLMPWIYRYPCSVVPDFTSEKLYIQGEVQARGKVTVFVFAFSLLRLLRDKEFMQVVRRVMKRDGS